MLFPELEQIVIELKKTNMLLERIEESVRVPDMIEWAKSKKSNSEVT